MEICQTKIIIDLTAVEKNLNFLISRISKNTKVMAVIKANAYGHGLLGLADFLKNKVDFFGVSSADESIQLRTNNIRTPILIFAIVHPEFSYTAAKNSVSLSVCDVKDAEDIAKTLKNKNLIVNLHLKIDTGMGRLGHWYKDALKIVEGIKKIKKVYLEGIYSHLACADSIKKVVSKEQINRFSQVVSLLQEKGLKPPICHLLNSAGILKFPEAEFDMVRPGLTLYGLSPCEDKKYRNLFYPAMKWITYPMFIKDIEKGKGISYGHTFITPKKMKIAILPIGYANGYNRLFSNLSSVLVHGKRCKVLGRVCMDQTIIDVTDIPSITKKTEVVILGNQKQNIVSAEELAGFAKTIPYEIVCSIKNRIKREYIT